MENKDLAVVIAYKDLDYSSGCDIISCDLCGNKMVVPSWAEVCPECGYLGIDSVEEDMTLDEIEKKYTIQWCDKAKKFKTIKTNR